MKFLNKSECNIYSLVNISLVNIFDKFFTNHFSNMASKDRNKNIFTQKIQVNREKVTLHQV